MRFIKLFFNPIHLKCYMYRIDIFYLAVISFFLISSPITSILSITLLQYLVFIKSNLFAVLAISFRVFPTDFSSFIIGKRIVSEEASLG